MFSVLLCESAAIEWIGLARSTATAKARLRVGLIGFASKAISYEGRQIPPDRPPQIYLCRSARDWQVPAREVACLSRSEGRLHDIEKV